LLLELLLTDTTLPRSIAFQLERLGLALDRLPDVAPSPELRAPLSALRSRIGGWEARELLRPLGGEAADGAPTALLEEVDAAMDTLRELATALENRFFHPSESTSRWGIDDV
ncbi:MAG: alpha-E domain-containing protein, partial [Brachybacterium sp.]|nr:alpha-E domain-containing protein [Brachybacterium sp.]